MKTVECNIWGKQFNPTRMTGQISSDVRIDIITEPGQIGTTGRYKDISTPYGACRIVTPGNIESSERINWMTDFISRHINIFQANGATDIVFHIEWIGIQGNMEFTALELRNLAALQIPLSITYIYEK